MYGKGSSVHDYAVGLRIVSPGSAEDEYAKVTELNEIHQDFLAAKVSLGVLGVLSQVCERVCVTVLLEYSLDGISRNKQDTEN